MASKQKPPAPKAKPPSESSGPAAHSVKDGFRETIESIAIAFVLAFLFRTFEAEAFVIPTGSMAPTLLGQHKDVTCVRCEFPFRVSASDDDESPKEVVGCTCPNCRYPMNFDPNPDPTGPDGGIPPTYKGDRIIVAKFPYEIGDLKRWDVAVFRYPLTAKTNFIKRIVGLPRETLQIFHGDIFTRPEGKKEFEIQRKPPAKVQAMQHVVYDNDYVLRDIIAKGWPARWQSANGNSQAGMWQPASDFKSFATDGNANEAWLRYTNFVPDGRVSDNSGSQTYWKALRQGSLTPAVRAGIKAQLITDFYGYNTGVDVDKRELDANLEEARRNHRRLEMREQHSRFDPSNHWVGDLALECELQVFGSEGEVVLELVEGGRAFQCRLNLKSGKATLSGQDLENFHPQADTPVRGPGTYRLQFANVDDQLLLWVDGKLVSFGDDDATSYNLPWHAPTNADLEPVGIAARKAHVQVTHLRVLRDVYYIADMIRPGEGPLTDLDSEVKFTLEADQFLALGDNSPRSKDSRLWPKDPSTDEVRYYVKRDLLIGKAMFIYWPHALDHIPGTSIWFPLFPNFGRMKFIR